MHIVWSKDANNDLQRLYDFIADKNIPAAKKLAMDLWHSTDRLLQYPRSGEALDKFESSEVRRLMVGEYEIRYEITAKTIFVLHIFHTREHR